MGNRYAYDEYGRSTYSFPSPTVTQPFGYASGYTDATGLIKFGTRYYDATLGRWTQDDPLGGQISDPRSLDPYVYAKDNPLNLVDPSGAVSFGEVLSAVESAERGCGKSASVTVSIAIASSLLGGPEVGAAEVAGSCVIGATGGILEAITGDSSAGLASDVASGFVDAANFVGNFV